MCTVVAFILPTSIDHLTLHNIREFLVKDGQQFLRLNLPTSLPTSTDPEELGDIGRAAQESIELVRLRLEQVGFSGKTPIWNASLKDAQKAQAMLAMYDIYKNIPLSSLEQAKEFTLRATGKLVLLEDAIRMQDISTTLQLQEEAGQLIYEIRRLSLKPDTLPYELPDEVALAAQLRGLAVAEIVVLKSSGSFDLGDGNKSNEATFTVTLDGYHAPITTGNFVDLSERKFYDGLKIITADELIVQTGDPYGTQQTTDGFIDPATRETRTIPLELFYKNDKAPTYSYTSDDDQRSTEAFSNPFQSYGAIGMAHDPEDVNTASSQFFMLKWDQGLVPPGKNTLDGSQTCFGYMTKGQELLRQVEKGDTMVTVRVVEGLNNFHATRTP
jgi:peptidylprolyl isomerase